MYATDLTPGNDATVAVCGGDCPKNYGGCFLPHRFGTVPKKQPTYPHARPGYYGLPKDCREISSQFARRESLGIPRQGRDARLRFHGNRNSFGSYPNEGFMPHRVRCSLAAAHPHALGRGLSQELRKFCCLNFVDSGLSPKIGRLFRRRSTQVLPMLDFRLKNKRLEDMHIRIIRVISGLKSAVFSISENLRNQRRTTLKRDSPLSLRMTRETRDFPRETRCQQSRSSAVIGGHRNSHNS
jgi:hypothetical protein